MIEIALQKTERLPKPAIPYLVVVLELVAAVLMGLGLVSVGMGGAAWILGGIAAGALVVATLQPLIDQPLQPNRNARKIGQMIIGLAIGLSLHPDTLDRLTTQFALFIGLPLFLMAAGVAIGLLYSRLEQLDILSAILATTPGNIGVMVSIAADYSKSTALVSLVQLIRFTSVILIVPLVANVSMAHPIDVALSVLIQRLFAVSWQDLGISCFMITIAAIAVYLGGKARVPMAAFLCAIGVGLLFDLLPLALPTTTLIDFKLPPLFNLVGQMLLGITIGEYWGISPRLNLATVARSVVPVALMFVGSAIAAGLIKLFTAWNWLTCLLIAAPGGSPEMIWIALTLHQDTAIVTTGHIVRLLAINLSLPLLVSLGCYLETRLSPTATLPTDSIQEI